MENEVESKKNKKKRLYGLIIVLALIYIVSIVLSYIYNAKSIELFKDIMGFLSYGLSISLAVNVTVNNVGRDQNNIGRDQNNNITLNESLEETDKHNVLTMINEIIGKTEDLINDLSLIDNQRSIGFVSGNEQRSLIEETKEFETEIKQLKRKLASGRATINDAKFNEKLDECIVITTDIISTYDTLYKENKKPFVNSIKRFKQKTIKELEKLSQLLIENSSKLKELK